MLLDAMAILAMGLYADSPDEARRAGNAEYFVVASRFAKPRQEILNAAGDRCSLYD